MKTTMVRHLLYLIATIAILAYGITIERAVGIPPDIGLMMSVVLMGIFVLIAIGFVRSFIRGDE